ncbi:P-loop containing nucleoside triphosphate hydrolase protein, partial [Entophlyctis helioformis]
MDSSRMSANSRRPQQQQQQQQPLHGPSAPAGKKVYNHNRTATSPDSTPQQPAGRQQPPVVTRTNVTGHSLLGTPHSSLDSAQDIAQLLRVRWTRHQPFTRLGSRALLALRPSTSPAATATSAPSSLASKTAALATRANPEYGTAGTHEPHLFDMAASAYLHMRSESLDQAVLLCGEHHASKTTALTVIERHLSDLGRSSDSSRSKRTAVAAALGKVSSIFHAFGHAARSPPPVTATSSMLSSSPLPAIPAAVDVSCFIRYDELQFNATGKLVGAKFIPYLLDISRIAATQPHTANFHVLYALVEGATKEERLEWHLDLYGGANSSATHHHGFAYLQAGPRSYAPAIFDRHAARFVSLRKHFKEVGIGMRQQAQIFQVLAAVLHLGNLTFQQGATPDDPAIVRNTQHLAVIGKLLGLHPATLETCLTTRTRTIGRDTVSTLLDVPRATMQRNALAQALYMVVAVWIVEQINNSLCKDESVWTNFVAILDTPGFDYTSAPSSSSSSSALSSTAASSSLQQFMLNYANERLFGVIRERVVNASTAFATSVAQLDLPVSVPPYPARINMLDLYGAMRSGIIPLLNIETTRGNSAANDVKFVDALTSANTDIPELVISNASDSAPPSFTICHYKDKPMTYDASGWTWLNNDSLQSSFVTMFRGTPEEPGTSNQFIRSLFANNVIATETHEVDQRTVVAARSLSRSPSTRRRRVDGPTASGSQTLRRALGTIRRDPASSELEGTLGHQFVTGFSELLETIRESRQWYVFCIKPSDDPFISDGWSQDSVLRQIGCLSILPIAQSPSAMYSSILPPSLALSRYHTVFDALQIPVGTDAKAACTELVSANQWTAVDAVCTADALYLSESAWRSLEYSRLAIERGQLGESSGSGTGSSVARSSLLNSDVPVMRASQQSSLSSSSRMVSQVPHFESEFGDDDTDRQGDALESDADGGFNAKQPDADNNGDSGRDDATSVTLTIDTGGGSSSIDRHSPAMRNPLLSALPAADRPHSPASPASKMSAVRWRWLCCTWSLTWWIPSPFLRLCGRMPLRDRQVAWREKVALCIMIALLNAAILFFIIGLGPIICPKRAELSPGEISGLFNVDSEATVFMYGSYYRVKDIAGEHLAKSLPTSLQDYWKYQVLGRDVSPMFSK